MDATPLRFGDDSGFFEMTLVREEADPRARGDIYVSIDVASGSFCGKNDLWIVGEDFTRFCRHLNDLNSVLKGEGVLESASPDELKLRIFNANSRGGMALEVTTGYSTVDDPLFWHSVKIGFTFEPQQLARVLALPWIAKRL